MSSIASETNSVQINSTEETNNIHRTNENQMEALHIVGGTTSNAGEQSESRQSGAEHPSEEKNSAEQGYCKTAPSESANKYKYAIFAGWAGERYVNWILKLILPYALWRTWWAAVSHQAPGKTCYVGAAAIARQEKVGERKIEIDLQEFEARGLMDRYRQRHNWPQEDGTIKYGTVAVKDFSRLYDLAYEYHLWMHSPEYVEAEWDNAEDIKKDARLTLKLLRFDNYRHILTCQKPGPKGKRTPLQEVYHCQLPEEEQDLGAQPARTGDPKANLYFDLSVNLSSPYRESNSKESYVSKENSTSNQNLEEGVLDAVEPEAIRKVEQRKETKKETREQDTVTWERKELKQEKRAQRVEPSNPIETQQKEEMSREAAKDAEEFSVESIKDNPIAMAMFAKAAYEEQERKKEAQKRRHERKKEQKKRTRRTTPDQLTRATLQIIQYLGGDPKHQQSDLTRMSKLYWTATQIFANFTNHAFLDLLFEARDKTAKHRDVGNRVPYFFTCLENKLGLSCQQMAYLRSPEPLYLDGHLQSFLHQMQLRYDRSGSHLDYDQWTQENYRC